MRVAEGHALLSWMPELPQLKCLLREGHYFWEIIVEMQTCIGKSVVRASVITYNAKIEGVRSLQTAPPLPPPQ